MLWRWSDQSLVKKRVSPIRTTKSELDHHHLVLKIVNNICGLVEGKSVDAQAGNLCFPAKLDQFLANSRALADVSKLNRDPEMIDSPKNKVTKHAAIRLVENQL